MLKLFFSRIILALLTILSCTSLCLAAPPDTKSPLPTPTEITAAYGKIINIGKPLIIIDKSTYRLYFFKNKELVRCYPVGLGRTTGQKMRVGDGATPFGTFTVEEICDSLLWTADDSPPTDFPEVDGDYGRWFIGLKTGWEGIGIHGTNNPLSIKKNMSAGCIRMNNIHVEELVPLVEIGMTVLIIER